MKNLFMILMFTMIFGCTATSGRAVASKSVSVQTRPLYKCVASSYHALGIGLGPSRYYAMRRALSECSIRTPYGDVCYIDWCKRIR